MGFNNHFLTGIIRQVQPFATQMDLFQHSLKKKLAPFVVRSFWQGFGQLIEL